MTKQADILSEFLDSKTIDSLSNFLNKEKGYESSADAIAIAFGSGKGFAKMKEDAAEKLVSSFKNNLTLLIQKTWVEKSDEVLKAEVLNQLEDFCKKLSAKKYSETYNSFFEILNKVVYLMFGSQTKNNDFADYALRIDPEFGIFWWYIKSLPEQSTWTDSKNRTAILLGMYFLANY